jgi:hypothetical protein
MTEGTRKKIVYALLPLALIWAVYSLSNRNTTPPDSAPTGSISPDSVIVLTKSNDVSGDLEARRNSPWGKDPFGFPTRTSSAGQGRPSPAQSLAWVLAGIVYNHQQPMALINSRLVKVGDKLGTATVVEIKQESVTLEQEGRRIILTLGKG